MVSRVLGFFLGVLFLFLGILPFINTYIPYAGQFYNMTAPYIYSYSVLNVVPLATVILVPVGLFCLIQTLRDEWPFYG